MKGKKWIKYLAVFICFTLVIGMVGLMKYRADYHVIEDDDAQEEVCDIPDDEVPLGGSKGSIISKNVYDEQVIPDKYNCGANGKLKSVKQGDTVGGVKLRVGEKRNIMEFAYSNKDAASVITIKNCDFSDNILAFYNEDKVEKKILVNFVNCKFARIIGGFKKTNVSYSFKNCSIVGFSGSNASFDKCLFGGSYTDCMVPFQSVTVSNSYFKDLAIDDPSGKGLHSDGTQIYGNKSAIVKDILFENCRFEIPAIETSASSAKVNACLMVQLEFNDANGIKFSNCKVNGGGYTIYAWDKGKGLKLENVSFEDIDVGCAHLFGAVYPKISSEVSFDDVAYTDSLYVSSVWTEKKKTHIIVSNDTPLDRTIIICTDQGVYSKKIKACPNGYKNQGGLYKKFADFPFDINVTIPTTAKYVVCYEVIDNQLKQLRFVNWTKKDIRIDEQKILKKYASKGTSSEDYATLQIGAAPSDNTNNSGDNGGGTPVSGVDSTPTIEHLEGVCGANVSFELNGNELVLSGSGATYDYHSKSLPPWYEYKNQIVTVKVGDGIVTIGNQIFSQLPNLKEVTLPQSLVVVKNNVFMKSTSLSQIVMPASVEQIGNYAFEGTSLTKCLFEGGETQWNELTVGTNNNKLIAAKCFE